ncbi:MAG TPA: peptide ABC transporter substrate-binding protein [Treponema sp.]|nr:peptide ABC transporter substrate-binding protein [Treponema sp.]
MTVRKFFALCGLAALLLCQAAAFDASQDDTSGFDPALQRTLVMINLAHQYDLNPHTASYVSEAQILSGLYEGLFSYDPVTLEPLNALCVSYKISRNKKRWTFLMREGATFSNGEAITAQTIKDSWLGLLSTPGAPYASLLDCISNAENFRKGKCKAEDVGIAARDDKTLVVHLDEPAEHLPRILCHHAFCAVSKKKGVYSGPFTLKSYSKEKIELVKNPRYYGAAAVQIPGIDVILSTESDENAYLFNTGKADWIADGNVMAAKVINKDSVHVSAEFGTAYLFFKVKNKPWDNEEFRNALLEAVPFDVLRQGLTVPAKTLVYPLAGYPDVAGLDDYDKADAIAMMNKARAKASIPYDKKLTLTFAIADGDFMQKIAGILKDAWEPLGVELNVLPIPADQYNAAIPSTDADLFSYTWIGDFADPLAFLELFRGNSSLNVALYQNSVFDDLLVQACRADSSSEHYELLAKAERQLLDDGMVIPIYHQISLHVIDLSCVGGWQVNALDLHPLKYLYFKKTYSRLPNLVMAGSRQGR